MISFPVVPQPTQGDDPKSPEAWTFQVIVPEDSPYFAGHFPGNPILPGVAQLALCDQLVRQALGPSFHMSGIRTMRYKSPALPGDELSVQLRRSPRPGELSLSIQSGDDVIASGAILIEEGPAT